jgi:hypothetical protein
MAEQNDTEKLRDSFSPGNLSPQHFSALAYSLICLERDALWGYFISATSQIRRIERGDLELDFESLR